MECFFKKYVIISFRYVFAETCFFTCWLFYGFRIYSLFWIKSISFTSLDLHPFTPAINMMTMSYYRLIRILCRELESSSLNAFNKNINEKYIYKFKKTVLRNNVHQSKTHSFTIHLPETYVTAITSLKK